MSRHQRSSTSTWTFLDGTITPAISRSAAAVTAAEPTLRKKSGEQSIFLLLSFIPFDQVRVLSCEIYLWEILMDVPRTIMYEFFSYIDQKENTSIKFADLNFTKGPGHCVFLLYYNIPFCWRSAPLYQELDQQQHQKKYFRIQKKILTRSLVCDIFTAWQGHLSKSNIFKGDTNDAEQETDWKTRG